MPNRERRINENQTLLPPLSSRLYTEYTASESRIGREYEAAMHANRHTTKFDPGAE
jgi:hypothetical protein